MYTKVVDPKNNEHTGIDDGLCNLYVVKSWLKSYIDRNCINFFNLETILKAWNNKALLITLLFFYFRYGSERSSVFVALGCLEQQLKTETRADVFTTVRKLRSQRQGMVQHVVSKF